MKKWLLLFLLLCTPAHAQKTPAQIQAEIAASSASGLLGGTILNDITNSYFSTLQASSAWTPVLTFGGGSTGLTFSTIPNGTYVKIGPFVHATFNFVMTAVGSSTGAQLAGLPFAPGGGQVGTCKIWYLNLSAATNIMGVISASTSFIGFYIPGAANMTAATQTAFTATSQMFAACSYLSG
jgi:hypothetical protein